MANLSIMQYKDDRFKGWNLFINQSNEGTIFHQLDFLMYHGERFRQQEHHLIWYNGRQPYGLMPMAIFEEQDTRIARSPYGGSYGGPVFEKPLNYTDSREVVGTLIEYLLKLDIGSCHITLPLSCCYTKYSETFRFALLECGFRCANRDISSVVSLDTSVPISDTMTSRARNSGRQASKSGITITSRGSVADFWKVMEKTYQKHGSNPTHTLQEFQWLCDHLPEAVYVDVAYINKHPVAGIGYFVINCRVNSSFYLCQDPDFQSVQALSGLVHDALIRVQANGFQWFDFGTSSVNMKARENIFRFKESFGALGLFRDTYVWQR